MTGNRTLGLWVAAGLAVRLVILSQTGDLGPRIADEQHYVELAGSLADGRGFAWATGEPTSLRPPLYPAMVAAVWRATGTDSLQAVRLVQITLSLVTALVVLDLGRRAFGVEVGRMAAVGTWLYPSIIYLNFTILTETLFTLLLVTFVWLTVCLVQRPRGATAALAGLVLGLGALTRSVLYPVPILVCPLLAVLLTRSTTRGRWQTAMACSVLVFAGYATVVLPWAVRNTRLQRVVTIVDTMGGMNLRMGNYEHTPEDRMWDAVSLTGEKSWIHALNEEQQGAPPPPDAFTEGMKDKWAQRKALEYMQAHPMTTLRRAVIKFGDFWGLERSFAAGVQQGLYRPAPWLAAIAVAAMIVSYALVVLMGAAGFWLSRPASAVAILVLLPVVVISGVHAVVFGHERYHVPLVPLLAISAAALWQKGPGAAWRAQPVARLGALVTTVVLVAYWARQVVFVDGERIRAFIGGF